MHLMAPVFVKVEGQIAWFFGLRTTIMKEQRKVASVIRRLSGERGNFVGDRATEDASLRPDGRIIGWMRG